MTKSEDQETRKRSSPERLDMLTRFHSVLQFIGSDSFWGQSAMTVDNEWDGMGAVIADRAQW